MLEPGQRRLFLDALRPPEGYSFDFAVGTTYTLDLMALLSVPLAFTFADAQDGEGRLAADPLALLESARRHAGRIVLFCHGGQTSVPRARQPALAFLEHSVVTALPPRVDETQAVFHPKVWALRYIAEDKPARYRLICQSRNLTFDASWDTSLVLDGELMEHRVRGFSQNGPLADFFRSLPALACQTLSEVKRDLVQVCADELRCVHFHPPEGLEIERFWAFGFGGANPDFPELKRRPILVVSPFLDGEFLRSIAARRPRSVLVSRRDALLTAPREALSGFAEIYSFKAGLELEPEDGEADLAPLGGLHAKVFVIDDGWNARLVVGSGNSTSAAMGSAPRNVEFMVELSGRKNRFGIDKLLKPGEDGNSGTFRSLIEPFDQSELGTVPEDVDATNLELLMETAASSLARADAKGQVETTGNQYVMHLKVGEPVQLGPSIRSVTCWPVSLSDAHREPFADGSAFTGLSITELSCFLAVEIRASLNGKSSRKRFVRPIEVEGLPEDRLPRLLAGMLNNRARLMQLLWLLLSPDHDLSFAEFDHFLGNGGESFAAGLSEPGLMERMLETLHNGPGRLDAVASLVADLRKTETGIELLGPEFDAVWEPLWKVRKARQ